MELVFALMALSLLAAGAWTAQRRIGRLESEAAGLRAENGVLKAREASLSTQLAAEQRFAAETQARLADAFKALSADALARLEDGAHRDLKHRQAAIEDLVKPLKESLARVDSRISDLETARVSAYSTLAEQVRSLSSTQVQLRSETANLVKALRSPAARGRWGEMQLQRVVELAGMVEHCDFRQQQTLQTEDGRLRPDLVVQIAGGRRIVVDAKVPLAAYLDGIEAEDETNRRAFFKRHAAQVRAHIDKLAARNYWAQFTPAPEFVVAFLPGEAFFSAALELDPDLIEYGVSQRVLPATPTTLIALLLSVGHGWRQEKIAQNAIEISALGKEIYDRLRVLAGHFSKVGDSLDRAVENYNKAAGALESRVLVSARRMREKGVTVSEEIGAIEPVERVTRGIATPELLGVGDDRLV